MPEIHWCDRILDGLIFNDHAGNDVANDCYVFDDIINVCDAFDVEIEENYDEEKEEDEKITPIEILEVNDDDSVENDGSVPACVIAAGSINHQSVGTALLALMDSGSSVTLIHRSKLPRGVNPSKLGKKFSAQMTAGNFEVGYGVTLRDVHLPEFSNALKTDTWIAYVFDSPCRYDMIVGRDWLKPNKFDIRFSEGTMEWFGRSVPLKPENAPGMFFVEHWAEPLEEDDAFAAEILPAKYEKVSIDEVVSKQTHLTDEQQNKLHKSLQGHEVLFDGHLKKYPHQKVHLEVKPDAVHIMLDPSLFHNLK